MTAKTIAVQQEQSVAVAQKQRGFDNFEMKDLIVPRLRLLQMTSKAVSKQKIGMMGQFQDSLSEEILGERVEVVLLGLKNGAVYFKDNQFLCKSEDGITSVSGDKCEECPFGEYWGKFKENKDGDDVPPGCSGTKEFMALIRSSLQNDMPQPILVSFMKTSYGLGKRLASMARLTGKDIFASAYVLGSEETENKKGVFARFTIKPNGLLTAEEFAVAERWYYLLVDSRTKSVNVKVHDDNDLLDDV